MTALPMLVAEELEGLLTAQVARCPVLGGQVCSFDARQAQRPGRHAVDRPGDLGAPRQPGCPC